jgi:tetratricopeptide (TPR) repeat protein
LSEYAPVTVDAIDFASAASDNRWSDAVRLYAGPFLDAVHVGGSPRWEQWVEQQRARHAATFEECCKRECVRLTAARDWEQCGTVAARWLQDAPLSPHAGLHLLSSHAAKGSPEDLQRALADYERLSRRLRVEYDCLPDVRIVAAAREIADRVRQWQPTSLEIERGAVPSQLTAVAEGAPEVIAHSAGSSGNAHESVAPLPAIQSGSARPWRSRFVGIAAAVCVLVAAAAIGVRSMTRDGASDADVTATSPPTAVTTTSDAARRSYEDALLETRAGGERARAVALLEQAIGMDTTFAMAYRQLAILLTRDESSRARTHELLTLALRHAAGVTERERQLITGDYHITVSRDFSRAASAFRSLLEHEPRNGTAWHKLGMVYQYVGDNRRAADSYRSAARLSPRSAATWGNLIDALHASGDRRGAREALEEMARALPGHPAVFLQTATWAAAEGDFMLAEQQTKAYIAATRADVRDRAIGYRLLARVLWAAGRHEAGDDAQQSAIRFDAERGDSASALRESLILATAPVWQGRQRRVRSAYIDSALATFPTERLSPADRPYQELVSAFALAGERHRAMSMLDEYQREVPLHVREDEQSSLSFSRGMLAMLAGKFEAAAAAFDSVSNPVCTVCGLPELGLAYEALGRADSAAIVYRRYMETPTLRRTDLADSYHRQWVASRLSGSAIDGPAMFAGAER